MTTPSPMSGFSHVQLHVSDVARSERWYSTVLGLERLTASDDGSYVALRHGPSKVVIVLSAAGDRVLGDSGALDHLAYALNVVGSGTDPPPNWGKSQFPIYSLRRDFREMCRVRRKR